jgi:hypothetical protein
MNSPRHLSIWKDLHESRRTYVGFGYSWLWIQLLAGGWSGLVYILLNQKIWGRKKVIFYQLPLDRWCDFDEAIVECSQSGAAGMGLRTWSRTQNILFFEVVETKGRSTNFQCFKVQKQKNLWGKNREEIHFVPKSAGDSPTPLSMMLRKRRRNIVISSGTEKSR